MSETPSGSVAVTVNVCACPLPEFGVTAETTGAWFVYSSKALTCVQSSVAPLASTADTYRLRAPPNGGLNRTARVSASSVPAICWSDTPMSSTHCEFSSMPPSITLGLGADQSVPLSPASLRVLSFTLYST